MRHSTESDLSSLLKSFINSAHKDKINIWVGAGAGAGIIFLVINVTLTLIFYFKLPIIFSHVGVGLNGSKPFLEELTKWAPNAVIIDRTNVNAWEEAEFVAAVKATGRKKLIMGGLWTDVCLAYPAIEATLNGYEVLVPEDTVGSITQLSHDNGMQRMIQAGVKPITWNVVLAELQRDHARKATEKETSRIFLEHLFKMDPDKGWQ